MKISYWDVQIDASYFSSLEISLCGIIIIIFVAAAH